VVERLFPNVTELNFATIEFAALTLTDDAERGRRKGRRGNPVWQRWPRFQAKKETEQGNNRYISRECAELMLADSWRRCNQGEQGAEV
jgi:hypothetical protein